MLLPGVALALILALAGQWLSGAIGEDLLGLPKSPLSPVMMAILLGIAVRNGVPLPALFDPGIRFSLVRILRLGIVLLGIRLGLAEAGEIGLRSLPVIVGCVAAALVIVTLVSRWLGLTGRLGTLIAAGTAICGATAIVALSPTIRAREDETAYAVACITLFGMVAMLVYPYLAHAVFDGDPFRVGLFLGTSVHDTAQVVGAGLVYQQVHGDAAALDAATVTKLVRNLGMLVVIPLLAVMHHRRLSAGEAPPSPWSMVPLFVIGFAAMSLVRTIGDLGDPAFGFVPVTTWHSAVAITEQTAALLLAVAMAAVGLGTRIAILLRLGLRPFAVGLFSAVLVGAVSVGLIGLLFGLQPASA